AAEVALSEVEGPETLEGPLTNPFEFVPGQISGHKFNDVDSDGVWDQGEPALQGWTIRVYKARRAVPLVAIGATADLAAWDFVAETVTAADGSFSFGGLLPGVYLLEEEQQPGWVMTVAPGEFALTSGSVIEGADFGNHEVNYTKTFELTYEAAPADATFFVEFILNDEVMLLDLEGDGPYTASLPVFYPWEIGSVTWFARLGDATYLLGETPGEIMEGDVTNAFTYTASVSGHKFSDDDGNAVWDKPDEVGLPGWTIGLYHQEPGQFIPQALPDAEPGYALYASTVTGPGGAYSFAGLLPGTYYVAEEQQDGWTMTVAPEGTFEIVNGSAVAELDFGNQEEFLPFTDTEIVKSADKTAAKPGDLVTYTLTYTNIGGGVIEGITITDDYDERYMTPVDVSGATVADGTLTWVDNVPLAGGGSRQIVYTMRVAEDMPQGLTHVDNVAVITPGGHRATWRVDVKVEGEPFLPFTGDNGLLVLLIAGLATAIGIMFRRLARTS
ncbi:MAG: SpaA isopeptide-forming pilin-related protein, partial [Coriobacteriales bacterium]